MHSQIWNEVFQFPNVTSESVLKLEVSSRSSIMGAGRLRQVSACNAASGLGMLTSHSQCHTLQFYDENMVLRDVAIGGAKIPLTKVRDVFAWALSQMDRCAEQWATTELGA